MFAKFSEIPTPQHPDSHPDRPMCLSGGKNISFLKNFAYVLSRRSKKLLFGQQKVSKVKTVPLLFKK